jgi:hypothetical protein
MSFIRQKRLPGSSLIFRDLLPTILDFNIA